MATQRQIEANRRNAALSTGPSEAGKSRSRLNATKHGMAGESAMAQAAPSPEFEDRRAKWAAGLSPVDEAGHWALDRAVAASFQIERCERAMEDVVQTTRERAKLAWDQDRAAEAAVIAGRLARDPALVARQLVTTYAGATLLLEYWSRLLWALEAPGGWSDSEASTALDLLAIPADLRSGWTPIDGPDGCDLAAFRRELALEEIGRLERLRDEALSPLDDLERRQAMTGDVALLSKPARLIQRYERDAWRRYRESIRGVQSSAPDPGPVSKPVRSETPSRPARQPVPTPVEKATAPAGRPPDVPARPLAEERRALHEEIELVRSTFGDPSSTLTPDEEDAWLADLERRADRLYPTASASASFVPITVGSPASSR